MNMHTTPVPDEGIEREGTAASGKLTSVLIPPRVPGEKREHRVWTRTRAIKLLSETNELQGLGGEIAARRLSLDKFSERMRKLGFIEFTLVEDNDLRAQNQKGK